LPVCRISSAVHSTALPPLQAIDLNSVLYNFVRQFHTNYTLNHSGNR
jgi:hypothetical protein